jgi:prepilin-type N-terminal cleavage/methylation domain-containing protein
MQRRPNIHPAERPPRAGFTLIELLIVVSIIAILMALSAGAYVRVSGAGVKSVTQTSMKRLDSALRRQTAYFADRAREDPKYTAALSLAGNDTERAKVLWMKLRFKKAFPTSFAEALNPAPGYLEPHDGYVRHLQQYGITGGTAGAPQAHESAACLYMILRFGPESSTEDHGAIQDASKIINGIPVQVDAWGTPLLFCRWPSGHPASGISPMSPNGYQQGFVDPLDPRGTLASQTWLATNGAAFRNVFGYPSPPGGKSLNLTPVIVSAGPDKQFGLDLLTMQITNSNQAADNIYSTDLR